MVFKKNDEILMTGQVLRKNPETNQPQTLNLSDEPGVIEKMRTNKSDTSKNSYWVKTQFGVHFAHVSTLRPKPE